MSVAIGEDGGAELRGIHALPATVQLHGFFSARRIHTFNTHTMWRDEAAALVCSVKQNIISC